MTSPGHFNGQTIPAYTDALADPATTAAVMERLPRYARDAAELQMFGEMLGALPYEGGRTDVKQGKPVRVLREALS